MKHIFPSYRVPALPQPFWIRLLVAASAALLFWVANGTPAETGYAPTNAATVWHLAEPDDLVTTSQGDDTTAFREEDAGFSAHHRVPDHSEGDGQGKLQPRLDVMEITDVLLENPDPSNSNRDAPGRHVDSGGNFGIVKLPMHAAIGFGNQVEPREVTVYYDDRGWVVAYLPPDAPAAGIWRYDTANQPTNNLQQNLLVLAINEVLSAVPKDGGTDPKDDGPEIANADHDTVGYYHWKYPDYNAFVLFNHESSGGTSDPVRFVVPPTIENILASAAVVDTTPVTPSAAGASLNVDGESVVSAGIQSRMAVAEFALERTSDASRLYEVTVAVDDEATAAGAVMLVYTRPGS